MIDSYTLLDRHVIKWCCTRQCRYTGIGLRLRCSHKIKRYLQQEEHSCKILYFAQNWINIDRSNSIFSYNCHKRGKVMLFYRMMSRLGGTQHHLLYDWRESCLLIGTICLHKSLCLPENWSKLAEKVKLDENQLKLVSRSLYF